MDDYRIELMTAADLQTATDWAEQEGWEPGCHDSSLFYLADKKGFFKGVMDDEIIATGSAVNYDDTFAFFGLYIVNPNYRGQGYGLALTKHRHVYCGDRNKGLDGVLDQVDVYARLGFKPYHENARYLVTMAITETPNPAIVPLQTIPFEKIKTFDRAHFPAPRDVFLKAWVNQSDGLSVGYVVNDTLKGYGTIRRCKKAYKIGPLFSETEEYAKDLFISLSHFAKGERIFLDIPCNNVSALSLVKEFKMEKVFATMRMYSKEQPILKDNEIYGITSFELG